MADSLAAASMMAGHPNDASPLGLRNIGFTIHVGALDNGFNRNKVAFGIWRKTRSAPKGGSRRIRASGEASIPIGRIG